MLQANSMTSRPRCTSPNASSTVLPCSEVNTSAISRRRDATSSRKANMMFCLWVRDEYLQVSKASRAAATTVSTSETEAKATSPVCSPVAGLNTGPLRPEDPDVKDPATQCRICLMSPTLQMWRQPDTLTTLRRVSPPRPAHRRVSQET